MTDEPKADRRAILDRLRADHVPESGPIAGGLDPTDKFVVASFFDKAVFQRFKIALSEAGVEATALREGRKIVVEVSYSDRTTAFEILRRHEATDPDNRPRGIRRDYDCRILGAVVGSVIGVSALLTSIPPIVVIPVSLAGAVVGFALGWLLDHLRLRLL